MSGGVGAPELRQVLVTCLDTGVTAWADVLRWSRFSIRVVLVGTTIPLTLRRDRERRPFVGRAAGLEFMVAPR